jgi:hypothetical protein
MVITVTAIATLRDTPWKSNRLPFSVPGLGLNIMMMKLGIKGRPYPTR